MSALTPPVQAPTGLSSGLLRRVRDSPVLASHAGIVGLAMVVVSVLAAVLAPVLAPYALDEQGVTSFADPSWSHLLGTDELGRDLFSRLVYAVRLDLLVAVVAIPLGGVVGTLLGLSGIIHPRLGQLSARLFDVIIGFPTLVFSLTLVLVLTPGTTAVIVAIAVVNVPVFGRLARGGMLGQLGRDYVQAAKVLGASRWRMLWRHVLPNIRAALLVQAAVAIADAVFIEGAMSILGVGVQPPQSSLGSMLQSGLPYLSLSTWYVLAPTLALAWVILGFALVADSFNARRTR